MIFKIDKMEYQLPTEIVAEILVHLNNYQLYIYASTSKTSMVYTEMIWKKRYIETLPSKKTDLEPTNKFRFWYHQYVKRFVEMAPSDLFQYYQPEQIWSQSMIPENVERVCKFIVSTQQVMKMHRFKPVMNNLLAHLKTYFFELDFQTYDLADQYLSLIFPIQSQKILIESLYPTDIIGSGKDDDEQLCNFFQ
jgi:hypothetical protein